MKYLLIVDASSLAKEIAKLANESGVTLEPPSGGWHLTILPPFELAGIELHSQLLQELSDVAQGAVNTSVVLARIRLHREGTSSTQVISTSPSLTGLLWLGGLAGECLDSIKSLLTEVPTLYPAHLTLLKGIDESEGKELQRKIEGNFLPMEVLVSCLTLLGRESEDQAYELLETIAFFQSS